jgi:hypothetical protein
MMQVEVRSIDDATAFRLKGYRYHLKRGPKGRVSWVINVPEARKSEAEEILDKCKRGHRGIMVDMGEYKRVRSDMKDEMLECSRTGGVQDDGDDDGYEFTVEFEC